MVKNLLAMQKIWIEFLRWEDPLEKGMATYSSILVWRIPMHRGAWWATVHGVAESDMTELLTQHNNRAHLRTHPCLGGGGWVEKDSPEQVRQERPGLSGQVWGVSKGWKRSHRATWFGSRSHGCLGEPLFHCPETARRCEGRGWRTQKKIHCLPVPPPAQWREAMLPSQPHRAGRSSEALEQAQRSGRSITDTVEAAGVAAGCRWSPVPLPQDDDPAVLQQDYTPPVKR